MKYLKLFEEWEKHTQTSGSGRTRWIDTVWDIPTSSKAYSSGILLNKDLKDREFDDLKKMTNEPDWVVKNMIKNPNSVRQRELLKMRVLMNNLQFLKDEEKQKGKLYCEYCGKGPLKIYDINPGEMTPDILSNSNYILNKKFDPRDGATADHKQPQSKGGDRFSYTNLAVCCYSCNQRKGSMSWIEWKNRMKL
jgi:hypothetical protein